MILFASVVVTGVYASAHWCPPCRQFTPMLAQFYTRMKAMGKPFEVVFARSVGPPCVVFFPRGFVLRQTRREGHGWISHLSSSSHPSMDQEAAAFEDYFGQMPWLALPFDGDEREQLMNTYQVRQ